MGLGRQKAEINVTPMIDVLLVLIIIFMVIAPPRSAGIDTLVPQPSDDQARTLPPQDIVLTVLGGGRIRLNQLDLDVADLASRLRALLTQHTAGVAFVKGKSDLDFGQLVEVIDVAKGAGWQRVALMPQ